MRAFFIRRFDREFEDGIVVVSENGNIVPGFGGDLITFFQCFEKVAKTLIRFSTQHFQDAERLDIIDRGVLFERNFIVGVDEFLECHGYAGRTIFGFEFGEPLLSRVEHEVGPYQQEHEREHGSKRPKIEDASATRSDYRF